MVPEITNVYCKSNPIDTQISCICQLKTSAQRTQFLLLPRTVPDFQIQIQADGTMTKDDYLASGSMGDIVKAGMAASV